MQWCNAVEDLVVKNKVSTILLLGTFLSIGTGCAISYGESNTPFAGVENASRGNPVDVKWLHEGRGSVTYGQIRDGFAGRGYDQITQGEKGIVYAWIFGKETSMGLNFQLVGSSKTDGRGYILTVGMDGNGVLKTFTMREHYDQSFKIWGSTEVLVDMAFKYYLMRMLVDQIREESNDLEASIDRAGGNISDSVDSLPENLLGEARDLIEGVNIKTSGQFTSPVAGGGSGSIELSVE